LSDEDKIMLAVRSRKLDVSDISVKPHTT
jgi:hypothetical protein